jgi:type II secretory pathway pseudopilin PulG
MCSRGSKIRKGRESGFTLLEALAGLVLVAVAAGAIADAIVGILKRSYVTIEVTRVSDESERFAAAFTQAGKSATSWAVYSDRAAYLADPVGNVSVQGNALVFQDQLPTGTNIIEMFEYDPVAQTLSRYEDALSQPRSLLNKVVPTKDRTSVFGQDLGLVQAHWTVQSPYELMDFEAYGNPLRMR